jgi:hypothetical protein
MIKINEATSNTTFANADMRYAVLRKACGSPLAHTMMYQAYSVIWNVVPYDTMIKYRHHGALSVVNKCEDM